jgi:hypothetical protein
MVFINTVNVANILQWRNKSSTSSIIGTKRLLIGISKGKSLHFVNGRGGGYERI